MMQQPGQAVAIRGSAHTHVFPAASSRRVHQRSCGWGSTQLKCALPSPTDTQPWCPVGTNPSSITGRCADPQQTLQESHPFSREPQAVEPLQQHPHHPMGTTAKNEGAGLKYGYFSPLLVPRTGQTNCCLSAAAVPQCTPRSKPIASAAPSPGNNAVDMSGFTQAGDGRAAISENGSGFQLRKAKDNSF